MGKGNDGQSLSPTMSSGILLVTMFWLEVRLGGMVGDGFVCGGD